MLLVVKDWNETKDSSILITNLETFGILIINRHKNEKNRFDLIEKKATRKIPRAIIATMKASRIGKNIKVKKIMDIILDKS